MAAKQILVHISTNVGRACPLCTEGPNLLGDDYFEKMSNHLLAHGLTCIHVGQETINSSDGKPWQTTVGVFGK